MKRGLLLIIFSLYILNCYSQNDNSIERKWYFIDRDQIDEITIDKDSLHRKSFRFDYSSKGKRAVEIVKRVDLNDRILFIHNSYEKPSEFYATILEKPKEKEYIKRIWNGIDTISTVKNIININKRDKRELLGYNLYSKEMLEKFKAYSPVETMTLSDFKTFYEIYLRKMESLVSEYNQSSKENTGSKSTFNFQIAVSALLEMNYNPIDARKYLEKLFANYKDDDEEIIILINNLERVYDNLK